MEFQIKLNSVEDAVRWVNRLEYYECHAEARVGNLVIDARSLMGLLGFGIGRVIQIVIHSELNESLRRELGKFEAA